MNARVFKNLIRSQGALLINKKLILAIGCEMAIFISDLAERDAYFEEHNPKYDGWFFSYKEKRSEELGMSLKKLQRLMASAVDGNLVEVKLAEPDFQKQWIRINYEAIYNLIEMFCNIMKKDESTDLCTKLSRGYRQNRTQPIDKIVQSNNTNNNTNDYKDSLCKVSLHNQTEEPSIKITSEPRFIPSAEKLAKIIRTKKNVKITPSKINNWSLHLSKLHKLDGVSIRDIDKALDWYTEHINDKYCPHIESGQTFREKYLKLHNQMVKKFEPAKQTELVKDKKRFIGNNPNGDYIGKTFIKFEE